MSEIITPPLRSYLEDKALAQAVDELVRILDGKRTTAKSWDESRTYSQALLMAASVRAAFVDALYEVWTQTWGGTAASDLGDEYFDELTVAASWDEGDIYRAYYTGGAADEGGPSVGLGVELSRNAGLNLYLMGWDRDDEEQDPKLLPNLSGWAPVPDDKGWQGLQTTNIATRRLLADPGAAVAELRAAAAQMVAALRERPGGAA